MKFDHDYGKINIYNYYGLGHAHIVSLCYLQPIQEKVDLGGNSQT